MAKAAYVGVGGVAHKIKKGYIGIDGVARKIKKGYIGDANGKARLFYESALPPALREIWSNYSTDEDTAINCITYANGYWVVGGQYDYEYARIAYATNLNGPWTIKNIWNGGISSINCITYADGYWVVGGQYNKAYGYIAYATTLDGSWTTKAIWNGTSNYDTYVNCITYANGYWVVGGGNSSYLNSVGFISYTSSLSSSWTNVTVYTSSAMNYTTSINSIAYSNGQWMAAMNVGTSSGMRGYIAYATSLSSWSNKEVFSGAKYAFANCITYADGYWVVGGEIVDSDRYSSACIAYATSPSNSWSVKEVWGGSGTATSAVKSITYSNGYWAACGGWLETYAYIAYGTSLGGSWTTKSIWSYVHGNIMANDIAYANGYWAVGGGRFSGNYVYGQLAYAPDIAQIGDTE